MEAVAPPVAERTQDVVIKRQYKARRDWAKWGLAVYFVIFLIFLYAPMVLMAILSFQGYYGGVTFPFKGPSASSGGSRSSRARSATSSRTQTRSARPASARCG